MKLNICAVFLLLFFSFSCQNQRKGISDELRNQAADAILKIDQQTNRSNK